MNEWNESGIVVYDEGCDTYVVWFHNKLWMYYYKENKWIKSKISLRL